MAKLKENSTILKSTGEEIIATEESVDRKLLLKADKDYVDTQLATKAEKTDIPTKVSELEIDVNFDERYYTKTETDAKLDEKVDNSRVLTDVPANAKFTDTITTINGKTGVITKDDIVALGIPAQDTTYSEISEAEIDVGTSSTKRVITGRRVKYILDKVRGWIDSLTKADIGLGNVDNVKQATKVEFDTHNNDSTRHITSDERNKWNNKANKSDIPTKVSQLENDKNYVTQQELDTHKTEIATQEQLGHVKAGQNITIDEDGTINAIGGNVNSVNGKTGDVTLSASDVGAVPTSRKVNNKVLTSDITIDVPDIPGLKSSRLALGQNASAGAYAVALGYNALAGIYAVALGQNASAAENYSVALGRDASAKNNNEGVLGGTGSDATSKWIVPGTFTVSGTKNFEIPHPKPEKSATHVIRHGAVESPTPGDTLYRWKIQATKDNDLVTIDLPDYFVWLNKDVQIFVTPQGHFGNGYGVLNRETEQLEIHCQFEGEYNVLVIGTRNDDHQSVQDWYIKGVEREIGESWTGETYAFSVDEIIEIEEIKEVSA